MGRRDGPLSAAAGEALDDVRPHGHVLVLERAHGPICALRKARKIPLLHGDDVGLVQGELHVELDQRGERLRRVLRSLGATPPSVQQPLAHADQQLGEDVLLRAEVAVERGPGHACRGAEVVDGDPVEATGREQLRGTPEDLLPAAPGTRGAIAPRGTRGAPARRRRHGATLAPRC